MAVTSLATWNPAQGSQPSEAVAPLPIASLRAAAEQVTLERFNQRVNLDLGIYLVAGDAPIDIRANRSSFWQPIVAKVVTPTGDVPLPDGTMTNFRRVPEFFHVRITNRAGDVVYRQDKPFCPGFESWRVRPDGPDVSTYPLDCPFHPYTRGAVFGVDPGWGVSALSPYGSRAELPLGRYTARVRITQPYRDAFGISLADATSTVGVRVVKGSDDCLGGPQGCKSTTPQADGHRTQTSVVPRRPSARPSGAAVVPGPESQPDLRSLPAFSIEMNRHKWVSFAATVWNAGPSPLVIDGFRRSGEDVMDAYQYFYEADGTPTGYAPAGSMEWDPRDGHTHWHFRDFARYRLLAADKSHVVRSSKEAFCLANTDATDYTVPGANWRPFNTDLHSACGNYSSISVREVLDAGSGDTYYQYLPGQSFNVSNLPNGIYYIAIEANPRGVMYESDTQNNIAYRKIVLKGSADNRSVRVPQKGIVVE